MEFKKYEKRGAYHWKEYAQQTTYGQHADHVKKWVKAKGRILDIGAGDGLITHLLGHGAEGVDDCELAVKLAQEKGVVVKYGSVYKLPYQNDSFDAVYLGDVIEHLEFPQKALAEINRVLKHGKNLYVVTPRLNGKVTDPYHYREYTEKTLEEELSKSYFLAQEPVKYISEFKRMYGVFGNSYIRQECGHDGLLYIIKDKLKNEEPMSLVRLGDGEARVMRYPKDEKEIKRFMAPSKQKYASKMVDSRINAAKKSMNKHLGYMPKYNEMLQIKSNLIESFDKADFIGVCMSERIKNKSTFWKRGEAMLSEYIDNINERAYCDMNVHYQWRDSGAYSEMFKDAKKVRYVSGRDVTDGIKDKFGVEDVDGFIIDAQYAFMERQVNSRHYPRQYKQVKKWIEGQDLRGVLCLVGAGMVGKNYCTMFKEAGGVAIDIGSVFDWWFGKVTRGGAGRPGIPTKGRYSYCDKYKIV